MGDEVCITSGGFEGFLENVSRTIRAIMAGIIENCILYIFNRIPLLQAKYGIFQSQSHISFFQTFLFESFMQSLESFLYNYSIT